MRSCLKQSIGLSLVFLLISFQVVVAAPSMDVGLPERITDRAALKNLQVDSVIVVFKDEAVTKNWRGKSSVDKSNFKSIKTPRKLIKSQSKSAKKSAKAETRAASRLRRMHTAKIQEGSTLSETLNELSASPLVEYVEPNYYREIFALPNDTHFATEQWSLNNTGQVHHTSDTPDGTVDGAPGADINWLPAWEGPDFPTNEIIIAVIDTGVDYTHPDITNQMWINLDEIPDNGIDDDFNGYIDDIYGIDPINADGDPRDDHGHGTHVAGTIAAEANNNYGIVGVCPNAKIMACKIFSQDGSGDAVSAAIESVEYAVNNGAMVLNNSWGGASYSQSMQDAVDFATERGVVFMAAAGNDGVLVRKYPASYEGVTCVAASDSSDRRASFSTYGPWVDVTAPGVYILSLLSSVNEVPYGYFDNDEFLIISGTSMATPTAAGAMGLLMSLYPGHEPWIYEKVMEASCNTNFYTIPENTNYAGYFGAGRIDVQKMLTYNETSAFFNAQINLDRQGANYFISPGGATNFTINLGAWAHDVTNLTLVATAITPDSSFNVTSHYVGAISAQTTTNLPDDTFVVTVSTNAEWGTVEEVRFDLKSGTQLLDSQTVLFQVFPASVGTFMVEDLDGDGRSEIIATVGGVNGDNLLMVFDETGTQLKWYRDFGGRNYDLAGISIGDIDNDGTKEIACMVLVWPTILHLGTELHVVEHDGSMNTNYWPIDVHNLIGDELVTPSPPAMADMDNDGDLDIICAGASSFNELAIGIFDEQGNYINGTPWVGPPTFPEPNYSDSLDYFSWQTAPALGDVDGDGTNEIVTLEYDALAGHSTLMVRNHRAEEVNSVVIDPDAPVKLITVHAAPTLADIDQDGKLEFIFWAQWYGSIHYLYVYDDDLSLMDGFPASLGVGSQAPASPSVADIDLDGDLEIFIRRAFDYTTMGLDHQGKTLPAFPLSDTNLYGAWYGNSTLIGNVDSDPEPELIYAGDYQVDTTDESRPYSFKITARDFDGLLVPGYPKTMVGEGGGLEVSSFVLELDALGGDTFGTNLYIITAVEGAVHVLDTGVPYVEEQEQWPCNAADSANTRLYKPVPSKLIGNFTTDSRYGFNTLSATFESHVIASNSSPVYYRWDFDNDGSVDAEGYGLDQTNYTYSTPGLYSVKLTFSNDASEVYTALRSDYIEVFSGLAASFTANPTGALTAPIEVSFADTTPGMPQTWSWDFDDGSTSTEQHPEHIYTNTGTFSVSLTISNNFGVGGTDVSTVTNLVTISSVGDATIHYLSPDGGHIYPFKSWADAATNLQAAVDASADGHEIIITNGTYYPRVPEGSIITVSNAVNIHSVNGPNVTIFDGEGSYNSIQLLHTNAILDGITIQHFVGDLHAFDFRDGLARNLIIRDNVSVTEFFYGFSVVKVGTPFDGGNSAILTDSLIENNRSPNSPLEVHFGGVISNCVVRGNEATGPRDKSFTACGAVINADQSIYNTLFVDNKGGSSVVKFIGGGALYNCTIVNNDISGTDHGALYFENGFVADSRFVYNTICHNNIGGDLYFNPDDRTDQAWFYNSRFSSPVTFLDADHVINCITDDPKFVDEAGGNYRLLPGSPCKDTGENLWLYTNKLEEVLVDFGWDTNETGGIWNDMSSTNVGAVITDMKLRDGGRSGIDLTLLGTVDSIVPGFGNLTNITGVTSDDYYWSAAAPAKNDTFMFYGDNTNSSLTDILRLSGIDTNYVYDFGFFATYDGSRRNGYYYLQDEFNVSLIAAKTVPVIPYDSLTGVWPTNSDVVIRVTSSIYRHPLSILEVKKFDPDDKISALDGTDLDDHPRVYNGLIDMGAYEYQSNTPPFIASFAITPDSGSAPLLTDMNIAVSDPDGSITNCFWDLGDGTLTNGTLLTNVTHTYTSPGEYVVSVTAYDNNGFSDNRHQAVFVSNIPSAPTNFAGVNISPTQNDLDWQDTSTLEDEFVMERRVTEAWVNKTMDDTDEGVTFSAEYGANNSWQTNTSPTAYGGSYRFVTRYGSDPHGDAYRASFGPGLTEVGRYEIFEWHPVDAAGSVAVVHEIHTENGRVNRFVDQSRNGGQWNSIGIYTLDVDSRVVIDMRTVPSDVFADAIRFERVDIFDPLTNLAQNVTNYTDLTVQDNRNYTYRLAATNGYGVSDWVLTSVYVAPTNQFPTATIVSVTPTSGVPFLNVDAVALGTDADGTVTNYTWDFGDGYAGSIQSGANLTNASYAYRYLGLYTITLTVQDNQGYSNTNAAEVNVNVYGAIPNDPIDLIATPNGETQIDLAWTDKAYNEEYTIVERKPDGGSFSPLAIVAAPITSYSDTPVTPGATYTYRVAATNENGISDWSNEATTNSADATAPILLSADASTNVTVVVTFNEYVEQTTAETEGNYVLNNGGAVLSAARDAVDFQKVTLTVAPLTQNLLYTLTVNNVEDLYGTPIATDSQTTFQYQIWRTVLFDLGQEAYPTSGDWNNVTEFSLGVKIANAVTTNAQSSGIGLDITDAFLGNGALGPDASALYPETAQKDSFGVSETDSGELKLTGLLESALYDLTFFGSRSSANRASTYTVGAESVVLDNYNNTSNTVSLTNISPDVNGEITLSVTTGNGADYGYLGVLDVRYFLPTENAEIEASVTELSVPEGSTNAFSVKLSAEPETETTVTVAYVSGDSDLSVQSGSNLVFTTDNWMTNQWVTLAAAPDADWFDSNAVFRCSSPGMADLDVTATEADDETNPDYSLPWSEPFEVLSQGALDGQHGWTADAGAIVTNSDAQSGSQSLSISEGTASHAFDGAPTNVWVEFWAKPIRGMEPGEIAADASAVFYVNTDDQIVAYSNTTPITLTGTTVSNGWNEFGLQCDYGSKVWSLELNDETVISNFPFYGNPASFDSVEFQSMASAAAFIDSINLTDSLDDRDGDGLPDWWENIYFGDLDANPSDLSSNGVDTVYSAYIAGLNPTHSTSLFELSNLRNVVQWSGVSGRVYTVYWTSNLLSGFGSPLTNDLPWTPAIFTDSTHSAEEKGFYKIEVELE